MGTCTCKKDFDRLSYKINAKTVEGSARTYKTNCFKEQGEKLLTVSSIRVVIVILTSFCTIGVDPRKCERKDPGGTIGFSRLYIF